MVQMMLGRTDPKRYFLPKKIKSRSPFNCFFWLALITSSHFNFRDGDTRL
jgi:hypothetical protein